jgi:membrane carboxypeptidase/penicillin-binding protein
VTVRQALAMSLNTPAVLALQHVGLPTLLDTVHRMGITSLTRNDYGLALTLGGGEVRLIDEVFAYSAFANGGVLVGQQRPRSQVRTGMRELDPVVVLKVETAGGKVLEQFPGPQRRQVAPAPYVYLINHILSDNVARTPVFGPNNPLVLPGRPAAAKTGTTDSNRDTWTMGYTPDLVTGVWVGNTDYSAMTADAFGSSNAAPIWNAFMRAALADTPPSEFVVPPGITRELVCASTGKLVGNSGCTDAHEEVFVAAALPPVEELTQQQKDATATAVAGATATAIATLTPQPTATPEATATATPPASGTATTTATPIRGTPSPVSSPAPTGTPRPAASPSPQPTATPRSVASPTPQRATPTTPAVAVMPPGNTP